MCDKGIVQPFFEDLIETMLPHENQLPPYKLSNSQIL